MRLRGAGAGADPAGAAQVNALEHENQYLKLRVAQLQEDVTDLSAELVRLRERLDHMNIKRNGGPSPNPLSGGQ